MIKDSSRTKIAEEHFLSCRDRGFVPLDQLQIEGIYQVFWHVSSTSFDSGQYGPEAFYTGMWVFKEIGLARLVFYAPGDTFVRSPDEYGDSWFCKEIV
jgi:hypothetical protein